MNVMIVDDSSMIRMILKGLLKQLGITSPKEAGDGEQALLVLNDEAPDLLLLDLHMPKMDGFELLSTLKADAKWLNLPIIIISSDTDGKQFERAQELGAGAFVKKPFRLEGLRDAMQTLGLAVSSN